MKEGYRDPTHTHACGNAQAEWRSMARLALQLREGNNYPDWAEEKSKLFIGIFKRLLTDPIDEVRKEARYKNRNYL